MSTKKKTIIEIVAFVLVFLITFSWSYDALRVKDIQNGGGIEAYSDTKVPVDVAIFGSSHAGCTVDNSIMWRDYGIASYTLWSGSQKIDGTYLFMVDAFKNNKPKVALVETLEIVNGIEKDRALSQGALTTDYSLKFVGWLWKTVKDNQLSREYFEEGLFRMPIVHSRYNELEKSDFIQERSYNRGYKGSKECLPCEPPFISDDREAIEENNLYYVDKIIDLCRENGVELVFFRAPFVLDTEKIGEQKRQNTLADYLEEKGVAFLDYYRDHEDIGIDFATDLREGNHVNDLGSAKVTNALAQYVKGNYDVPDRRGSKGYEDWDTHARFIDDRKIEYQLESAETVYDYLDILSRCRDRFSVIVQFNGNYKAIETYAEKPAFYDIGGDDAEKAYELGGVLYLSKGSAEYYSEDADVFAYYRELPRKVDLNIYKSAEENLSHVLIADDDMTCDKNGFRIIVYDEECAYLVDTVYVDVFEGANVYHEELSE